MQFVIPASPALVRDILRLRELLPARFDEARPLFVQVGSEYVDVVVDGLVLDFLREGGSTSPRIRSLVEKLAGLIKSVAHGLVGQAFAKMSAERAASVLGFLDERLMPFREGHGLGVPLDPAMAQGIARATVAAREGRLSDRRAEFLQTMRAVIDRAIDGHYKKPFSLLELGFLVRKGVDLGYDAIRAGAMSTIEKAIAEADEQTLADLAHFLEARVVREPS